MCPGSSKQITGTVSATTGDYTYTWSGDNGITITPNSHTQSGTQHKPTLTVPNTCNGSYTVSLSVTDGYGCTAAATPKTVTVKDDAAPTIASGKSWPANITGQNNCYADRDISGLYSNDQVKALFTDNCSGTITVTHTDAQTATSDCGWTVTRTYTIKDACGNIYYKSGTTKPTMSVSGKDQTKPTIGTLAQEALAPVAKGDCKYAIPDLSSAAVTASSDGCGGTITFVSQSPTAGSQYTQDATAQNIPVTVKVKDKCGNEQTKDVTVTIPAKVSVSASANPTTICLGANSTVSANATGATNPTYSWSSASSGAGMPSATNIASITVIPTTEGSKTYTVLVTGDNGCTATDNVTVTVNDTLEPNLPATATLCAASSLDNNTVTITSAGTTSNYNYTWSTPNATVTSGSGTNAVTLSYATAGTYTVTMTAEHKTTHCISRGKTNVTVYAVPTVTISGNTSICQGSSTTLTAGASDCSFAWSDGLGNNATTLDISTSGTYTVTATNTNTQCKNTASETVTVNALPTVTVANETVCQGNTATLTADVTANASGSIGYQWYSVNGGTATELSGETNPTYSTTTAGTYRVEVTNSNTCTQG